MRNPLKKKSRVAAPQEAPEGSLRIHAYPVADSGWKYRIEVYESLVMGEPGALAWVSRSLRGSRDTFPTKEEAVAAARALLDHQSQAHHYEPYPPPTQAPYPSPAPLGRGFGS